MKDFLPNDLRLKYLLEKLRPLCWGAADILMAYARNEQPPYGFSKVLRVEEGHEGPVSAADIAVNNWLMDGLDLHFPSANWSLLSEETAKENSNKSNQIDSEWLWILDPLDGTKDFLMGSGEYAVHLALIKGHRPLVGIVVIPELEELWIGVIGNGTWCENRRGKKKFPTFSNRKNLADMILVASRSHRDQKLENLIQKLEVGSQKSVGSIGCKVGTILRGDSDIYLSLSGKSAPKDWDMAAPEAVLRAAGGELTHADLSPLLYNTGNLSQEGCLIASNGSNHTLLCKKTLNIISEIDPDFSI